MTDNLKIITSIGSPFMSVFLYSKPNEHAANQLGTLRLAVMPRVVKISAAYT